MGADLRLKYELPQIEVSPYFDLSTPSTSLSQMATLICYFITPLQLQMLLGKWFICEH